MNKRAAYLIQILERIGSPLMTSMIVAYKDGQTDPQKDAQTIATLLTKTVQLSINMGKSTDLADVADDSVRVALAGLSSPLIAALFTQNGQIPDDGELRRIDAALKAVMTFSENFTSDSDSAKRLEKLEADDSVYDTTQMNIQYIQALIPAINAIGAFSFGQPEQKLIMDVASRLSTRAESLRKTLLGDMDDMPAKAVNLALLKALVQIYAACHDAQTALMSTQNSSDGPASFDSVWKSFDSRAAMLESLAQSLLPGGASSSASTAPSAPPPPTETPPPEPKPAEQSAGDPPPSSPPSSDGGNPMSMFAKPTAESEPEQTPSQDAAPSAAPPPSEPREKPDEKPSSDDSKSSGSTTGVNPMSFFSTPKKNDDDD